MGDSWVDGHARWGLTCVDVCVMVGDVSEGRRRFGMLAKTKVTSFSAKYCLLGRVDLHVARMHGTDHIPRALVWPIWTY